MGLLDNPQDAALLQLGLGLLSAGGPSRMPVSLGQAIGSAGNQAMDRYAQVKQQQDADEMKKLQMEQVRAAIEQQKLQQQMALQFPKLLESLQAPKQIAMPYQDQITPEMVGSNGLPQVGGDITPQKYFDLAAKIPDPVEKRSAIEAGFRKWPELRPTIQQAGGAANRDPSLALGAFGAQMGAAGLKGSDSMMKLAELMKPTTAPEGATLINAMTGEREHLPKYDVGMRPDGQGGVTAMPGMMEFLRQKTQATVDPVAAGRLRYETGQDITGGKVGVEAAANPDNLPKAVRDKVAEERIKKENDQKLSTESELNIAVSSYPQLDKTVEQLKTIGKDATYTYAGQARDAIARQVGIATPGAVAREKYIQTVRDVLFPQLRATFGAQFTVREGEALVATLGDPNKTPEERNAALDSFIDQKKQHIESLARQSGAGYPAQKIRNNDEYNALPSGTEFIDPFGKRRRKP